MDKKGKIIILVAVLFLAVIAFSSMGIHYTSQPNFCSSCHVMKSYYTSWEQSTHKKQDCLTCHKDPGLAGTVKVKVKGLRELALTVAGTEVSPKAEVPDSRCQACHQTWPEKLPGLPEIKFDHRLHNQKFRCADCHAGIVHQGPKDFKMADCLDCHKGQAEKKGPVENCGACHTGQKTVLPDYHQVNTWLATHGATALAKGFNTCSQCHETGSNRQESPQSSGSGQDKTGFCNRCHGTQMPHGQRWLANHGSQAQTGEAKAMCNNCHGKKDALPRKATLCTSCHSAEGVSHPAGWLLAHGKQAKTQAEQAKCNTCHGSAANPASKAKTCNSCHRVQMPHPAGWQQSHGKGLTSTKTCNNCHSPQGIIPQQTSYNKADFCTSCHTTKNPHPPKWISLHKEQAFERLDNCRACHNPVSFCGKCHN